MTLNKAILYGLHINPTQGQRGGISMETKEMYGTVGESVEKERKG